MPNPELEEQASERPESPAPESEAAIEPEAEPEVEVESEPETEPESAAKPPRGRLRTAAVATGTVLLLGGGTLLAILGAGGFSSDPEPDLKQVPAAYRDLAAKLPWPHGGETALWAAGIGDLGTCGEQKAVPIASVAKVMTAYVVLKDHPLADGQTGPSILVDHQAELESFNRDESSAPVHAGQRLSERALLELMLVPSANNVARLLARWDAGTQDAFVAEMNAASASLGMKDTVYTDPSGFDSDTRSTAADQLKLAEAALTDPTLLALTAEPVAQVPDSPTVLPNTNQLLGYDGVVGGKTGSSTPAGGALMFAAHRTLNGEDRLVLGVVLHQNSGSSPDQGLGTALIVSRRLVDAVE